MCSNVVDEEARHSRQATWAHKMKCNVKFFKCVASFSVLVATNLVRQVLFLSTHSKEIEPHISEGVWEARLVLVFVSRC